nr:MAG TPA: hypothetical protein [Caudoviricetes sp.]
MAGSFNGAEAWEKREKKRTASFDGAAAWAAREKASASRATSPAQASTGSTAPVKTAPTAQPSRATTMPAKASSPMFRTQQTPDTRTSYQKALDEAMMKRAAADRKNRERGRRSFSRSHAQEVREITGDRTKTDVGSLVKSAAAGYAADMVGAADTLLRAPSGLNYAASRERGEIEAAKKNVAMYEEKLKTAKSNEERAQIQRLLDRNKRIIEINSEYAGKKAENYRNLTKGAQETLQRTYQNFRSSAAENMQKANEGQNAVGQLLNNVAVAGMQMGADIAAGLGRATVPMATRVFGGSSQEAMEEGIQPDMTDAERLDMQNRALLYGAGSAGVSVLSEKLSNVAAPFKKAFGSGVLDKAINRAVAKMGGNAAGKIAMSFASEGFEEMFEDAVQPILQSIYNGQSVGENYSELEISDMLYDGLVGGILGGLGGGVEVAANRFARFDNSLGESGRKAIRGTYQEGKDTAEHVKDFIPAYNAGVEGKANPNPTNETAYAGYVAGQNDAKAEARKKTFAQESDGDSGLVYDEYVAREMNSTTADEINTVAKALGVRVRMADEVRGGTANGVIEGNEIRIAKDAQDPVMQVVGHEWTHRVQDLAPEQYTAFRSAIMENDDVAEAAKILHEQYNRMGVEISMEQAMDEAAANYAGEMISNTDVLNEFIRRHSADRTLLEKLRDAIREIVGKLTGKAKQQAQTAEGLLQQAFEAAAQNSKNAATEGGVRFMFAGENATNANKESLSTAKEMEKGGTDAETIRQKTGWFRGADGKWRWEIDDSGMKLRFESGLYDYDTELREKTHAWDRLTNRELTDEQRRDLADYQRSTERGEADEALYEKLTREFGGDFEKWALTLETMKEAAKSIPNYTTLGELVDAPALFATYPDMKDMDVMFQTLERGQNGGYNRRFDSIELSRDLKNRPEALLNSLIHEVQHAIQQREGFTPGANPKYWNRKLEEGYDGRDAETRREGARLREQYEQMKANDPEFMRSMEELNAMAPTVPRGKVDMDTWEQVEPDPPEWVRFDERRDQLEEKYGDRVWDYFSLRDSIDRNARDSRLPGDLYRDTAGEIEARDAAARRGLTAEERRNRKPDTGDENTVFADGRESYSIDPYFSENVREWYEEGQNVGERFTLGSTGDVLQGLGAIESDIYMNGDKISRILSDHPEMTIEEIEKIPELLEDPVLILKSKGRGASKANSRVVLYGTMKAQNGEPVMAVLDLRPSENGFVLDDMQKVNSAYTKKNPANFVAGSDVLYADKKRTVPLLRQFGLTITSRELLRNGSIGSISYENGVVKLDGVPLSEVTGENVGGDYSLKGTENAQEIAALKRENETLRDRVDYWKSQTRRSDGVRTDSKSVEKAAKELTRRYGAEIEDSEIAGDLANLYDYIARGGDETGELTYTEARSRADAIAQRIAESAIAKDDEVYRTYGELRKYLKDTKITLSSEDAAAITDYADFRRGLFGKVNLGKSGHTNVDQVYSELAENYPEFFNETRENNVSDQIARIADVANELYSVSEYTPFEGYMGQAVSAISNDIMERFFDLPQAKKTFADVQAEKLDAAKAAGRKAAADAKLAGQMAQGRTDAVKLRHTQEALQKARTQQAEKLDALRNRYREKDATRREKQANRELRAKITRHAKDLSKKLLRPTDKRHIPEEMRSAVAAVLNSINQESAYTVDESGKRVYDGGGTPTQRTEAFRTLQAQYKAILKNDEGTDMVIDPSLLGTDESDGLLEQVISMKDKRLSELTREELGTLWKTIRAVEKSVSTAGKVLSKSKFETTTQMADSFKNDLRTRRKKLGNNTSISLETPYTFFAHYGETGKSIYRMLRDAQDHQEVMARDVAGKVQQVLGGELSEAGFKDIAGKAIHGDLKGALRDARGSAIGKWEAETHDITVANGGKLTLTTPQIMELYLLSKRKQALGHLLGGGVIQPEIKSAETGRTKVPRGTMQIFLTDGDIERITGKLTDEQKRVADGLQGLTATTLANYGNEASMKAYGYRKFTERNYWPIKSAREGVHSNLEKDSGNVRSIKNIGMAQQVQQNANNAVELHSVFDTFADHASDMIDYAAWLTTMEDLNRFYNYQYRNDAGLKTGVNVKGLLDEKGGKGSQQYWQKLMGDIQNGISAKDFEPFTGKMGKFVGKFKGASVGANIRVVIQQPTAFFRAAAVLDPKDMAKGMAGGVTKGNGWEKAMQYSPTAMRKDVGSFDISSPYTLQERFYGKEGVTNKLNDLAGAAAGKADAVTWGKLWNACEWQVKREKPDVRAGSNEFYHAVNEAFTDMIDQTQVVDGILQRSNIMRGKSTLSQQATAFMGEPIMSLNVLMRSYDNFRYEENPAKRSKALKTLGRAATALVVTNVVNALAQSIADGLRDDDRDKDYWEKVFSAFTGVEGDEESAWEVIQNVVLNGNIGDNMNPIGQIPFAKDILSLAQGYDVSRPDMEVFADMIKAGQTFIKSIDGGGKKTRKEATLGLIAAASKMFGLPVSNIKRDLMATLRTIAQASGSLGFQYEVEKFSYNLANSGNRSRFIGILYDALEQGDYATYEHVRRDLMEQMGLNGESIQSSLKERYKKRLEADGGYTLPKKALDILGVRGKYAESEEKEAKFSAKDLDAGAFSRYEAQRTDTYRKAEEKATGSGAFQMLSDEGKDKALNYANTYAEETALASTAGGRYTITTKWVQEAQEAQQKYRIDPGVFAACRAAASECKTLKDRDGKAIDKSRGMQIMEMLFRSGLNEQQRKAMYEYLGVPESMRHWNRARVDEQLKIARRKAT